MAVVAYSVLIQWFQPIWYSMRQIKYYRYFYGLVIWYCNHLFNAHILIIAIRYDFGWCLIQRYRYTHHSRLFTFWMDIETKYLVKVQTICGRYSLNGWIEMYVECIYRNEKGEYMKEWRVRRMKTKASIFFVVVPFTPMGWSHPWWDRKTPFFLLKQTTNGWNQDLPL